MSDYELVQVETLGDWDLYHAIRREVLFEARGRQDYNPNLPDERHPGNIPLLLKRDGLALGTVRLDHVRADSAIVRLVAIRRDCQRQGHGRVLLRKLEDIAHGLAIRQLLVHAAPDAVGFYERHGYEQATFDPESQGDDVQLRKFL